MGNFERRRRVRVVYRSLQYHFLGQFFIYSAIIVFFLAVFLFLPDMIKMGIALIALLGVHSFLTFHRLSGPLYRFRMTFNQIRDGEVIYPIKIRDRDFLHTEEEVFNEMIDVLADKLQNIQQAGEEAQKAFHELEAALDDGRNLMNVGIHLDKMISEAGYFKVTRR